MLADGYSIGNDYRRMIAEIEEVTAPFQPSILLTDDASKSLLEKVYRKGIELN
ncbi:MAG: hypothetical protein ACM3X9_10740 [Bacillota bacterium]